MASYYVYSGATGSADGSSWANAYTTLAAALSAHGAANDVYYVADDHSESTGSAVTLTINSGQQWLCVRRSGGSVPPVSADLRTTAVVATTGANNLVVNPNGAGTDYVYGVNLRAGNSTSSAVLTVGGASNAGLLVLHNCLLENAGNNAGGRIGIGQGAGISPVRLLNTAVKFAHASQQLVVQGNRFRWEHTANAVQGTVPTTLLAFGTSGYPTRVTIEGVDLSALGSGKNLIDVGGVYQINWWLYGCKLGASVSVTTGSWVAGHDEEVRLVNCDSADTSYRFYSSQYPGTVSHETTVVKSGGASDGTTPFSRKMVSNANAKFVRPLEFTEILAWVSSVGSAVTATVEVVTDNVTLKDTECWLEVDYMGTGGYPLTLQGSDRASDILAAGANQTTSSATWTTTGLTTPVKQKLEATFTPVKAGWVRCKVCLAKASTTVYVDPLVSGVGITSQTNYMAPSGAVTGMPEASGGGMYPIFRRGGLAARL